MTLLLAKPDYPRDSYYKGSIMLEDGIMMLETLDKIFFVRAEELKAQSEFGIGCSEA